MLMVPFQLAVYAEPCSDERGCGYFSDTSRFYILIPNGWSSTVRDGNLVLTGQGVELEVSSGSLNGAPLEQVADQIATEIQNNPNLSFTYSEPTTSDWGPGYYYQYKEFKGTENERDIDSWLITNDGKWYDIRYRILSSQYDRSIIDEVTKTMSVGAQYDQMENAASSSGQAGTGVDSNSQAMQELQDQREQMWADNDKWMAETRQKGLDDWLDTMQQGVEHDRKLNEEAEEYQKEKDNCMQTYGTEIC